MTHPASGNPTWQDWPSESTLITAAALENIEGALDRTAGGAVQARSVATQTIATPGWAQVALPIEDFDDFDAHSTSTNTGRFALPAGVYRVSALVMWAANQSTTNPIRQMRLVRGGGAVPGSGAYGTYVGGYLTLTIPPMLVTVESYIELQASAGLANATVFGGAEAGAILIAERVR